MLTGEFEFGDNFQWEKSKEDFGGVSSQILFVAFLIFGSIVIANLLIGLTISQTEQLSKEAGIFRLEAMVQLISKVEKANTSFNRYIKNFFGSSQMYDLFCISDNNFDR